MTTNFRALCVELVDCLEKADWPHKQKHVFEQWIYIARKALAQPEPEGPSDEELRDLWSWSAGQDQGPWPTQQHCFAHAVLARFGHQPTPPADGEVGELVKLLQAEAADDEAGDHLLWMTPADARRAAELLSQRHPTPVPVAKRLPGPEDCDAEGLCWVWNCTAYTWGVFRLDVTVHSHWLPFTALPLPAAEVK